MDKEFWKSFLGFLDSASEEEINARLEETQTFLKNARSPEVRGDAKRMIQFMEQELFARAQVRLLQNLKQSSAGPSG